MKISPQERASNHEKRKALQALGTKGITTIQASGDLDVIMSAPTVLELRGLGWNISTLWRISENANGQTRGSTWDVFMAGLGARN